MSFLSILTHLLDVRLPDLCGVTVADDCQSSSTIVDVQLPNHVTDKAEHVRLPILVVYATCCVYEKQYVSLLPARSLRFPVRIYQTNGTT